MNRVKICGITNSKDALKAASFGAWAVGFIFYKKSPRHVGPYKVKKIIKDLPPFVTPVGVFVNQKEGAVRDILKFCGINTVQFHGEESPSFCARFNKYKVIKVFRISDKFNISSIKEYKGKVDAFLFDTFQEDIHGGTGKTFNWQFVKSAKNIGVPIILSGGLNPSNVQEAVSLNPYAVDVSSGVEQSPGIKNERLMREFFLNADQCNEL